MPEKTHIIPISRRTWPYHCRSPHAIIVNGKALVIGTERNSPRDNNCARLAWHDLHVLHEIRTERSVRTQWKTQRDRVRTQTNPNQSACAVSSRVEQGIIVRNSQSPRLDAKRHTPQDAA